MLQVGARIKELRFIRRLGHYQNRIARFVYFKFWLMLDKIHLVFFGMSALVCRLHAMQMVVVGCCTFRMCVCVLQVALYKRMFDLYERSLELDEIAAVLRGEVNQGVHLFRKILKTQLLLCLPVEITEAEIFGKRGEKRSEDGANCEGAKY